jgi:hypothetical protein
MQNKLLDLFLHILEPMRRREPTRVCPTLADGAIPAPAAAPETVAVSLAVFKRVRLEMRDA